MNADVSPPTVQQHHTHAFGLHTPDSWARAITERTGQTTMATGGATDAPMTVPVKLTVELVHPESATDTIIPPVFVACAVIFDDYYCVGIYAD